MAEDPELRLGAVFDYERFVERDLERGVLVSRSGVRWCRADEDFWNGLVASLEHAGLASETILRRTGVHLGRGLGEHMVAETQAITGEALDRREMVEFSRLVEELWSACGLGRIAVRWDTGERGFLPVMLHNDPLSEIGVVQPSSNVFMEGVLEGFFRHFAGTEMICVQTGFADGVGSYIVGSDSVTTRVRQRVVERTPHASIVYELSPS